MDFQGTAVTFTYYSLEADPRCAAGANNSVTNSCGIHFHEGTSCEEASLVGGHFYNATQLAEDPWTYG